MILSVDPGEHIGVCLWTEEGELTLRTVMDFDTFGDFLDNELSIITKAVIEDYRLRGGKQMQQTGSRFEAVQVIGQVRDFARRKKATLIRQKPDILRVAAMHAGVKLPTGHIPDDLSAYLHGFYYFETVGILKPVLQSHVR